nr:hypothetical protein [Tanacetum cinerariifolium]
DSITAGLGVDPDEAYPALIENKVDSLHLPYAVVNAGLSGETTAGGRSRLNWVLSRQPVSVFVLELGGNDGLRGLPLADTRKNLQSIIDTVRQKSPQTKIVLAGMQIPPNMGPAYAADFKQLYADIAAKNKLTLIPFLLENVGGIAKLNQADAAAVISRHGYPGYRNGAAPAARPPPQRPRGFRGHVAGARFLPAPIRQAPARRRGVDQDAAPPRRVVPIWLRFLGYRRKSDRRLHRSRGVWGVAARHYAFYQRLSR